jgi:hypothetical protein
MKNRPTIAMHNPARQGNTATLAISSNTSTNPHFEQNEMKFNRVNKIRSRTIQQGLFLVFLMGCLFQARASHAGFLLTLSLGNATQLSQNEVAFDIQAHFSGSGTYQTSDYVNSFSFSLDTPGTSAELKTGTSQNFDRFSFDSFRSGWDNGGAIDLDTGIGGLAATDVADALLIDTPQVTLARMKIDTTGLGPGLYMVSLYDSSISDAAGSINSLVVASMVTDFPTSVNLNATGTFTISVVPEPSSMVIAIIGASCMGVTFRRSKRRERGINR